MATTKKATKKAPAKKSATKRAPAKSSAAKVTHTTKSTKAYKAPTRATKASKTDQFMSFHMTHESCYWIVFGAAVITLALWVLSVNIKVNHIYDQIDQTNRETSTIAIPQRHARHQ